MKKFFFLTLALAVCAFTFVGCDKEKDKEKSNDTNTESVYAQSILGTWQYDRFWDGEDQRWYGGEDIDHFFYIFDAKGNLTIDYNDGDPETYKYSLKNEIIYMDGDAAYKISSISSDKMVLMYVDGEGDYKMEFKKIN